MNVGATQNTILIVEDDDALAQLMGERLSKEGFIVSIVRDGLNAQAAIRNQNPDLVVLDIMLPGIDGFETCRRIRQTQNGQHIPVVFITGYADNAARVKGKEVGCNDFLVKPVDSMEMLARVKNLVIVRR